MKIQYPGLAKLRTFTKDMDPAEFLSTEFRQIVRALEQANIEIPAAQAVNVDENRLEFMGNLPGNVVGSKFAFNGNAIKGTFTGNTWRPAREGLFGIEFSVLPRVENVPGPGIFTSVLRAYNENNTLLGDSLFVHNQGIITQPMSSVLYFATLTSVLGVYFETALSVASFSRFNCKIFRVSKALFLRSKIMPLSG